MDFIVAETPRGPILHDLDSDIVAEDPTRSPAGLTFRTSDGVFERVFLVPNKAAEPAYVRETIAGSAHSFAGVQTASSSSSSQKTARSTGGVETPLGLVRVDRFSTHNKKG